MTQQDIDQTLAEARDQLSHAASAAARMTAALSRALAAVQQLSAAVANIQAPGAAAHTTGESTVVNDQVISRPSFIRGPQSAEQPIPVEMRTPAEDDAELVSSLIARPQSPLSHAGGFSGFGTVAPPVTASAAFGDGPAQPRSLPESRPVALGGEAEMVRRFNDALARSLAERSRPDPDELLKILLMYGGQACKGARRAAGMPGYLEVYLLDDQVLLFPPNNEIGALTAHMGALFELDKSLPAGSAIQVVQPARLASADLKYPPSPGTVRKGCIKLIG